MIDLIKSKPTKSEELSERTPPFENMVWIPGGAFMMGSDKHYPEEAPAHEVTVDGFWMDMHTVTNEEFRRFVEATRYVTSAERAEDYPGAKTELLRFSLPDTRNLKPDPSYSTSNTENSSSAQTKEEVQ